MITVTRLKNFGQPQWLIFQDGDKRQGKEVGSVLICELGKIALICFIWVWPKQRRKGYASKMVRYLQGVQPDGILLTEPDFKGYDIITTAVSYTHLRAHET